VRERLKVVVPITVLAIFFLLYLNTRSAAKAGIVMLAVPFSVVGAVSDPRRFAALIASLEKALTSTPTLR
jgi:Cu/Ag efflux pump CusA